MTNVHDPQRWAKMVVTAVVLVVVLLIAGSLVTAALWGLNRLSWHMTGRPITAGMYIASAIIAVLMYLARRRYQPS